MTEADTAVHIRPARESDHDVVRDVLRAAYAPYRADLPAAVFDPYLADVLDVRRRLRHAEQLVATHDGRVVGTVTYFPCARDDGSAWPQAWAGLRGLGVHPAARGLGIGRLLTTTCRDRAAAAGAPVLALHSAAFMPVAVGLYERLGFRRAPHYDFDSGGRLGVAGAQAVRVLAYRLDLAGCR